MAADDIGFIGKLRGKRTRDVELPNTRGTKDPRLETTWDRVKTGWGVLNRELKKTPAKRGKARR